MLQYSRDYFVEEGSSNVLFDFPSHPQFSLSLPVRLFIFQGPPICDLVFFLYRKTHLSSSPVYSTNSPDLSRDKTLLHSLSFPPSKRLPNGIIRSMPGDAHRRLYIDYRRLGGKRERKNAPQPLSFPRERQSSLYSYSGKLGGLSLPSLHS